MDNLDLAYFHTFTSAPGQMVIEDLRANFYDVPLFNPAEPSALGLSFREGQRSIILDILNTIDRAKSGFKKEIPTSSEGEGEEDPF